MQSLDRVGRVKLAQLLRWRRLQCIPPPTSAQLTLTKRGVDVSMTRIPLLDRGSCHFLDSIRGPQPQVPALLVTQRFNWAKESQIGPRGQVPGGYIVHASSRCRGPKAGSDAVFRGIQRACGGKRCSLREGQYHLVHGHVFLASVVEMRAGGGGAREQTSVPMHKPSGIQSTC